MVYTSLYNPSTHTQEAEAGVHGRQAILYHIASLNVANLNYKKEEKEGKKKGGREKREERKEGEVEAGGSGVRSQPLLYDSGLQSKTLSQTKASGSDPSRGKLGMAETGLPRAGLLGQWAFSSRFQGR